MSKSKAWLNRRGQPSARHAIDQLTIDQPQPGEQIQQLASDQIADNPYQVRRPFDTESLTDLIQSMEHSGFQSVLIVRPHPSTDAPTNPASYQLVFGHRRRTAWQQVCDRRGDPCILPVIVRDYTDAQMLTIGSQENLNRTDLNPVEEAELVEWHQQVYRQENQQVIAAMLGRPVGFVKIRSRIHKLPNFLKAALLQRHDAVEQILEAGKLARTDRAAAEELAQRIVDESLTLDAVRKEVSGYVRPQQRADNAATHDPPSTPVHDDPWVGADPSVMNSTNNTDDTADNEAPPSAQVGADPSVMDVTSMMAHPATSASPTPTAPSETPSTIRLSDDIHVMIDQLTRIIDEYIAMPTILSREDWAALQLLHERLQDLEAARNQQRTTR